MENKPIYLYDEIMLLHFDCKVGAMGSYTHPEIPIRISSIHNYLKQ